MLYQKRQIMTDAELKRLAVDVYNGDVFTDKELPEDDEGREACVFAVFLPLRMMTAPQLMKFHERNPELFFQRRDQAVGETTWHGKTYPTFDRFEYLTAGEAKRFWFIYAAHSRRVAKEAEVV